MAKQFPIYKGLQKPLIYRGFQGKFIGWGVGSLVIGVVLGGLIGSLTSMVLGGVITISVIAAGLFITSQQQKKGLHSKTKYVGVFQFATSLKSQKSCSRKEGMNLSCPI
tara:strand:+ start:31532 stop:31858 length:327 start_codon:yes stop_codon:yes gene_type:complete